MIKIPFEAMKVSEDWGCIKAEESDADNDCNGLKLTGVYADEIRFLPEDKLQELTIQAGNNTPTPTIYHSSTAQDSGLTPKEQELEKEWECILENANNHEWLNKK